MNSTFKTLVLWQDGSDETVYDGKWASEAEKAGRDALDAGAVFADLYVYDGETVVDVRNITPA